ncbi:MAG TPA: DinB family protein [Vicinamibacterales bacterium]|nr:DinB family protein [Vicinamibacterales bacterium]
MSRLDDFLRYWDNARQRTLRVAELVPADRMDWTPGGGVWTFADLIRHLAVSERWMFVENARGRPSRYTSHGAELADGKDAILKFARDLHQDSMAQLRTLSEADLDRAVTTPGGASLAAWKWLRSMAEHEAHHRGQIYVMLRLCGIETPPLFGLTSEEVRRRGRHQ